jgi:hypothetical protein
MKRVNLPAAMRQQVSIKKLPIIDQKRMASVYRRHRNSIKSEALLRSNSQEAMSLLEGNLSLLTRLFLIFKTEGNHDLLIKHLAAQSKLLSSSPRSLIPFVIIVRASKPLDLISPATVNIRAGDYAGEIDLSKSAAWFLIFGRQPQTHAAVEQPAVVSASDSSSGAAGSLNRVTPVVEEQQKTQQLQSPAAAVESSSSSSDQKLPSTTTFRMEHLTQLAYIPNPRIPPPETYKWFDCEELFGTTSTSKQNLADAEKQNNKNSSDEEPVESPHHSTTSLSENSNEALQCCVCLSDPATIMMLPCRHVCMCFDCFRGMEEDEGTETAGSQADRMKRDWEAAESCEYVQVNVSCNQCPVCRSKVKAWVEISK